jgi:hypothetical protein
MNARRTSVVLLLTSAWLAARPARAASSTVTTAAELQTAVANAGAGDIITVSDGSYVLTVALDAHGAGTSQAPITLVAANAHRAQVTAAAGATEALRLSGSWWVVDGIDFAGGNYAVRFADGGSATTVRNARLAGSVAGVRGDCGGADAAPHCDGDTLTAIDVTGSVATPGCSFAGVEIVGGIDWTVRGASVHDVAVDTLACPLATTYGVVARGNAQRITVEGTRITGVAVGVAFGLPSNACEVRGATGSGTCVAPTSCTVQSSLLRNLVIWGTSDDGVLLADACNVNLHGATLWNDGTDFAGRRSVETRGTSTVDISDTILNADLLLAANTTQTGTSNLVLPSPTDATWFVDAAGGNFRLVAGAPPIDQGAALADLPTDYDGVPRPQGPAFDIGAFERPVAGSPDGGTSGGGGSAVGGGAHGTGTQKQSGCACSLTASRPAGIGALALALFTLMFVRVRR